MKKILGLVFLLSLVPFGLPEAQIIHCDTTYKFKWVPCYGSSVDTNCYVLAISEIECDTFPYVDSVYMNLFGDTLKVIRHWGMDSVAYYREIRKYSPNWRDSIEVYSEKRFKLWLQQDPYFYSKDIEQDIKMIDLQRQIFELRAILQEKGVSE